MSPQPPVSEWQTTTDHAGTPSPDQWQSTADHAATDPAQSMSVLGFGGNVLKSAGRFAGDLAGPLLHPVNTLSGVTGLMEGMAEKSGSPPVAGQSHGQYVDALAKMYSDRYGGWGNFRKTLYNDPIGVLSDIAAVAGAGGAAARGVELGADAAKFGTVADVAGKVADAAGTVEKATNPLSLAGKVADVSGVTKAADNFAGWAAQRLRKGALRGGYSVNTDPARVEAAARAMGENQIPLSQNGVDSITQSLTDLQNAKQTKEAAAGAAGLTVNPSSVATRLDPVRASYASQVNPDQDLAQIEKVRKNFLAGNPGDIPVDRAEALKSGTYGRNNYNAPPHLQATADAEKALAHGLMEEIQTAMPEVGEINQKQQEFLGLQPILEKAVTKYTNSGGFLNSLKKGMGSKAGLSLAGVGTGAAIAAHSPELAGAGLAAQVMQAVLSDPAVKARMARAIEFARQANPGKYVNSTGNGLTRVNEYIQSLQSPQ